MSRARSAVAPSVRGIEHVGIEHGHDQSHRGEYQHREMVMMVLHWVGSVISMENSMLVSRASSDTGRSTDIPGTRASRRPLKAQGRAGRR